MKKILGLFFAVAALGYVYFANSLIELNINISKYAELNKEKNNNWKSPVLEGLQKVSNTLLPEFEILSVDNIYQQWLTTLPPLSIKAPTFLVDSEATLINAISKAIAGDIIEIAPIEVNLSIKKIKFSNEGTHLSPIIIRGAKGQTILNLVTNEGFYIDKPYWVVEGITFKGVCDIDHQCGHAIHLVGNADNTVIQNNKFLNFNAHIKANGNNKGSFPDNVKIMDNEFRNEWIRYTNNPVVPIDVVGGSKWLVNNNFISDFARKHKKNKNTTYGLYLKGGSTEGIIQNNIVACEWKVPHLNFLDTRIGISLGGGGTGQKYCMNRECTYEHKNGVIKNNLILNCKNDVAIYINKGDGSSINNNTFFSSLGIDVRFVESQAKIDENALTGRIKARDGAEIVIRDNVIMKHFIDE